MWMSMTAVVGVVGRWRVVVEWRGEVRVWRRVSTMDFFGWAEVVERVERLCGEVGGLNEKGSLAAESVWCRVERNAVRDATWDWCWMCSITGFSKA